MIEQPCTPINLGVQALKQALKLLPETPGIYQMFDEGGRILYIGKAKNIRNRVQQYTQINNLSTRIQRMVFLVRRVEIIVTFSEAEALTLEANLIKKHHPPYNVLFRDDKSYAYITIDKSYPWNRIHKYRGVINKEFEFFGPFSSTTIVNSTLKDLQKAFLLRSCPDHVFRNRTRPCLLYDIKLCSAPCVHKISQEDYQKLVTEARLFLKGHSTEMQTNLQEKMQQASQNLEFERAAEYRDRIAALSKIQAQDSKQLYHKAVDVIAIAILQHKLCVCLFTYRLGKNLGNINHIITYDNQPIEDILTQFILQYYEKRPIPDKILTHISLANYAIIEEALKTTHKGDVCTIREPKRKLEQRWLALARTNAESALQRNLSEYALSENAFNTLETILQLTAPLTRVEIYDNSHLFGKYAYGVMVVANREGFLKQSYRKFRFSEKEGLNGGDDYEMMYLMLKRRFRNHQDPECIKPDLLVIDGGKGQVTATKKALDEIGVAIPILGVAKGPQRNAGEETLFFNQDKTGLSLPKNSPALFLIQRWRDEAHRFAITTYRHKHKKELTHSQLDDIPNIGPKRKKRLLHYFGSTKAIAEASLDDLQKIEGINKDLAATIYHYYHGSQNETI